MSVAATKKENKRQLRENDRIGDFTIVKRLGHGGYGDIYLVKSRLHPDYLTRFAMKIEYPNKDNNNNRNANHSSKNKDNENNTNDNANSNNKNNNQSQDKDNKNTNNDNESQKDENNNNNKKRNLPRKSHLYIEKVVLNSIQDSPYFPRYISFGQTSLFRFLVMECFGPSLSLLRHVLPTGKYSLSSSLRIGIQMLRAINSFHEHGYIHRDIKPSNFLIAASLSHPVILIDFGLARRYKPENSKISSNNSNEENLLNNSNFHLSSVPSEQNISSANQNVKNKFGFAGTAKYASINAHENKELSKRDDLLSWFYSLLEISAGSLPWSSIREKDDIYIEKKNVNLDQFIEENSLPPQFCSIRVLLESYSKTDEPNYDLIESFLDEAMHQNGSSWNDKYEWQRIDEESLRDLSSISLKPPKGDKYIPKRNLPEPILPFKLAKSKHKNKKGNEVKIPEIESLSKTKPRRFTAGIHPNSSLPNSARPSSFRDTNKKLSTIHYAQQVDNQGRYPYFSSSDENERYGHFGSDQLFTNVNRSSPSMRYQSFSYKKTPPPSPNIASANNNDNNNNILPEERMTNSNNRKKYVTTIKRHSSHKKKQRKRRNSDPRKLPKIGKSNSSTKNESKDATESNEDTQGGQGENDNGKNDDVESVSLKSKAYKTLSTSNSIVFIHSHRKNDDDTSESNSNTQSEDYTCSSNSVYYTYHSYSSGDNIADNLPQNRAKDRSYSNNNSSNYYDSDSEDFSNGEKPKANFNFSQKPKSSPRISMEPIIDINPANEKKNSRNCLIQ